MQWFFIRDHDWHKATFLCKFQTNVAILFDASNRDSRPRVASKFSRHQTDNPTPRNDDVHTRLNVRFTMNRLSDYRERLDNSALQRGQSIEQWHATFNVDHHLFSHRTISVESKNLLITTVVGTSATTATATKVATTVHGNDANDVANF